MIRGWFALVGERKMLIPFLIALTILTFGIGLWVYVFFSTAYAASKYIERAKELVEQKEFDKALELLEKAEEVEPENSEIYILEADIFERKGLYHRAVEKLKYILDQGLTSEEFPEVYVRKKLGSIFFKMGAWRQAFMEFLRVLRYREGLNDHEVLYGLGKIYAAHGKWDRAIRYLRKATELRPNNYEYWLCFGLALFNLELRQEAVRAFSSSVKLAPDNFWPNFFLALSHYTLEEFRKGADILFTKAKNASETVWIIRGYKLAGEGFKLSGDFDGALSSFKKALDYVDEKMKGMFRSLYKEVLFSAGASAFLAGENSYEEAERYFSELEKMDPAYRGTSDILNDLRNENYEGVKLSLQQWISERENYGEYFKSPPIFSNEELFDIDEVEKEVFSEGGWETVPEIELASSRKRYAGLRRSIDRLFELKTQEFYRVASRIADYLGFRVLQRLAPKEIADVMEGEGIDLVCQRKGYTVRYLIAVRRWRSPVSDIPIRNFTQRMAELKIKKGIFITTSTFTDLATKLVEEMGSKIELIDGEKLEPILEEVFKNYTPAQQGD